MGFVGNFLKKRLGPYYGPAFEGKFNIVAKVMYFFTASTFLLFTLNILRESEKKQVKPEDLEIEGLDPSK